MSVKIELLKIIGGGVEGRWSGGVRGIRSTFQMPEKQGDKDNMSGGEAATKKKLQLTLVATSEKENCLYHSTYIF